MIRAVNTSMSGFALLSSLQERGRSGHTMQPPVNQRRLNFNGMYEPRTINGQVLEPLSESITKDTCFSSNNLMTFIFYGVFHDPGNSGGRKIGSQTKLSAQMGTLQGVTKHLDVKVYAENLGYGALNGKHWKRLLHFFNRSWVDAKGEEHQDTDPVELADKVAFATLFEKVNVKDVAGFVEFLAAFKLEDFYGEVDDQEFVYFHLERFGAMMRTVVPVRVGNIDGQHRANLLTLASNGYFQPEGKIPMVRYAKIGAKRHQDNQLWKVVRVAIAEPVEPDEDMSKEFEQYRKYGAIVNQSQNYTISTKWINILEALEGVLEERASEFLPFDWTGFWAKEANHLVTNWRIQFEALSERVIPYGDFGSVARGTRVQLEASDLLKTIATKICTNYAMICSKGVSSYAPSNCSHSFALVLHFLKVTCHDRGALSDLISLINNKSAEFPQIGTTKEMQAVVRDFDWMEKFLLLPCKVIGEKFADCLIVERYIVEQGRLLFNPKKKKGPFVDDFEEGEYEALVSECKTTGNFSPLIDRKEDAFPKLVELERKKKEGSNNESISCSWFGMKSTGLHFKLNYTAQYALIKSAIAALEKYGAFPRDSFPKQDSAGNTVNWSLTEYLSGP